MQMHSIQQNPNQNIHDTGLSDLHEEEFKLFAMEYNSFDTPPSNHIEYYVNTLKHHNEDYDPRINNMFLNNLNATWYAMQMQNIDVLTHAHRHEKTGRRRNNR
jgi:hypothetical protein